MYSRPVNKSTGLFFTNYEFEVPDFWNMFEYIINDYSKRNFATLSKRNHAKGLIPENEMFCKMPVRLLADLAYTELFAYRNKVGDWKI